jgi:hypothetical protein
MQTKSKSQIQKIQMSKLNLDQNKIKNHLVLK